MAFASGARTIEGAEILFPRQVVAMISNYPPGTSLLQTPFVWIAGWRGAAVVSVICLIALTLLTMRLLRDAGRNEAFALLIPGFAGAAFFGRVAMSDVPAAAMVALGLHLLWKSEARRDGMAFLAGLSIGLTTLFREPSLVLLAPFAGAAVVHGRVRRAALSAGVAAGLGARLGASSMFFGSPWYVRDSGYGFSIASLSHTVPVYAFALLVLFPGGALLPFLYRGTRRAEMRAAFALYVLTFLLYSYDPVRENGLEKGLMLASRFMIPLLPLFVLMAADVWPRLYVGLRTRIPKVAGWLAPAGGAAAVMVAFAVHPFAYQQERVPLAIVRGIYSSTDGRVPVVTNTHATLKYMSPAYGARELISLYSLSPDTAVALATKYGSLSVVILDRDDSEAYRAEQQGNDAFLASMSRRCTLASRRDERFGGWARLRVFELSRCA